MQDFTKRKIASALCIVWHMKYCVWQGRSMQITIYEWFCNHITHYINAPCSRPKNDSCQNKQAWVKQNQRMHENESNTDHFSKQISGKFRFVLNRPNPPSNAKLIHQDLSYCFKTCLHVWSRTRSRRKIWKFRSVVLCALIGWFTGFFNDFNWTRCRGVILF